MPLGSELVVIVGVTSVSVPAPTRGDRGENDQGEAKAARLRETHRFASERGD